MMKEQNLYRTNMQQTELKLRKRSHYYGLQVHRQNPEKLYVYGGYNVGRQVVKVFQLGMNSHSRKNNMQIFICSEIVLTMEFTSGCIVNSIPLCVCHIYLFISLTTE